MTPTYRTTDHVLVRIEDLHKAFDGHVVLDGVKLEIRDIQRTDRADIQQGQICGILGPSGVGKSTLFNIIAGLLDEDSGSVMIDNPATNVVPGSTTEDLIRTRRGLVGVVYQDYQLFGFMRVEQLLMESLNTLELKTDEKEAREKIEQFLSFFQLEEHRRKFPNQLSGGQRQRVAIAQQLIRSPQLLLMDEPFSGLDPETKGSVVRIINDIAKRNEHLTMIIVSHDISSALKVSDTIYMMGRNRDEAGVLKAGASILHGETINLKDKGLAWSEGDPEVAKELALIEHQINGRFPYLSGRA